MTQPFRAARGGAIDRGCKLSFTFNGLLYSGYGGDTLASALLANGVHLAARSFKYHRPRGIYSAGPEEPCAMVQSGEAARVRPAAAATMVELYEGLSARSINCWPSAAFDVGAVNNLIAGVLPAGFYYKTFMWPSRAWMFYEGFIRRVAGIGRTPQSADADRYDKRFEHCDVLVVGGGPAGIAAARAAGERGARVLLVDERHAPGGQLAFRHGVIDGVAAHVWLEQSLAALAGMAEVRMLTRTTAAGYYDHNLVVLDEKVTDHLAHPDPRLPRQRLWKVRAKQVIVAAGAIERGIVFGNNDLPGVMLAGAAQRYAVQYAVRPGERAVLFTNNDSAYEAAYALLDTGVQVAAIVDARRAPVLAEEARARGITVHDGSAVAAAHGRKHVGAVTFAPVDASGMVSGAGRRIACDLLAISGGWDPAVHLYSQSGGRLCWDAQQSCFVPDTPAQAVRAAGAANGAFLLADCVAQGRAAGMQAVMPARTPNATAPLWEVDPGVSRSDKKFVDLQSDVTAADLALAAREGYTSVEHAKRYTTTGMGIDQGKTGNVVAYGVLGRVTARGVPEVGATTFRPPYTPVTLGALAGRDIGERLEPWRRTPMTDWHAAAGAVFEPVGLWRRPMAYLQAGEDLHAACMRECRAVREAVGVLDASTLGKIDIQGVDAVQFLNRVYTNGWDSLAIGRCRYGLMLRDDGMVFDDGVTARLGAQHYLMHTTSGGADGVAAWLEDWLQCEWRELKVYLTPVTAQWATVCVTGPRARDVLLALGCGFACSRDAFPHMSVREGTVAGLAARVLRVSFTGELSYEINVAARHGQALWEAVMQAGARYGITPFGTEALHALRAEKGYIVVGHDTDGTVTPGDLGLEAMVNTAKGDFLGRRALARSDLVRADRRQLVGLLPEDAHNAVPEGSQVIAPADAARIGKPPVPMLGHVTSSSWSSALGRPIALALIAGGRARMGETVAVVARGKVLHAKITDTRFYDAAGARLDA